MISEDADLNSSLKAVQVLARDYDATLRKVQLLMEELNQWSSLASDIETEARSEDINLSGPMMLGGHFVKVLLFRAILRPFQTASRGAHIGSVDLREAEAYRLSRAGAKTCVTSFVAFTADLKSGWVHGFWPFCMCHSGSDLNEEARTLLTKRFRVHIGLVNSLQSCTAAPCNCEQRRGEPRMSAAS